MFSSFANSSLIAYSLAHFVNKNHLLSLTRLLSFSSKLTHILNDIVLVFNSICLSVLRISILFSNAFFNLSHSQGLEVKDSFLQYPRQSSCSLMKPLLQKQINLLKQCYYFFFFLVLPLSHKKKYLDTWAIFTEFRDYVKIAEGGSLLMRQIL